MDIYADSLQHSATSLGYQVAAFTPSSWLERWSENRHLMRVLRYLEYPRKAAGFEADIHHVVDHGYAHLLPKLGAGKRCITAHDLIPMLRWKGELFAPLLAGQSTEVIRKPRLNIYSLSFLASYDGIIAVSQSSANDLQRHLGIAQQKITVIPPVIEDMFAIQDPQAVAAFAKKYQLDPKQQWLLISGQQFYKNHPTSLAVLKQLLEHSDLPVNLIKTGRRDPQFDALVASMGLSGRVKQVYFESQQELPLLHAFVDCLLFPSLYEGFGMPAAEALACGTPVVASNRGALPEVVGELAPTLHPYDTQALTAAVACVLKDSRVGARTAEQGPQWVKQFRAKAVSRKLHDFYANL